MHIHMTKAFKVAYNRYPSIRLHARDQTLATARHEPRPSGPEAPPEGVDLELESEVYKIFLMKITSGS